MHDTGHALLLHDAQRNSCERKLGRAHSMIAIRAASPGRWPVWSTLV